MGHEILAFSSKNDCTGRRSHPIALLRYHAFDPMNAFIYKALRASEFYGRTKGIGKGRYFQMADIEKALNWLPMGSTENERQFLEKICLFSEDRVYILFD